MKKWLLGIFLPLLFIFSASGQGTVRGKVTDEFGQPVIGANIVLKSDPSKGTITDLDGNYSFKIADTAPQTIVISFIGYIKIEEELQLADNKIVVKDFGLKPNVAQMSEVVIEAKAIRSRDYYMERVKVNSPTSIDYISSETMKKTGDSDVSAAVKRVSGVSSVGSFVIVRGLADRYIKTTVNGMRIPTLDPFSNNIRLDLFPAGLVDNLIITKTSSPDIPGDWAGAYLSIETKDYPEQLSVQVSTSFGYNTQSTFNEVVSARRSSTDWLGFDNGYRDIPDGVPQSSEEFPGYHINPSLYNQFSALGYEQALASYGITSSTPIATGSAFHRLMLVEMGLLGAAQFNDQNAVDQAIDQYDDQYKDVIFELFNGELAEVGQKFENNWTPTTRTAPLNFSQSLSIGNQTVFLGRPLGFLLGFRYGNSVQYDPSATINRTNVDHSFVPSDEIPEPPAGDLDLDPEVGQENNGWSALANLSYKFSPNHSVSLLFMPNLIGQANVRKFEGGMDNDTQDGEVLNGFEQIYRERKQFVYQYLSEHYFPGSKLKLTAKASYADGERNVPDFKNLQYLYVIPQDLYQFRTTFAPDRRFRSMEEDLFDSFLSLEIPLGEKEAGKASKLSIGGAYQYNERRNSEIVYRVEGAQGDFIDDGDIDAFFSDDKFEINNNSIPLFYLNPTNDLNNDIGLSTITAGFAMLDYSITNRWRFAGGLRVEHSDIQADILKFYELNLPADHPDRPFVGVDQANPASINRVDFLPSANFVYKISTDELAPKNLRMSFSQSIARPSFREISFLELFDYELRARVRGNPDLDVVNINNYDLRFESYFASGDNISLSLFYKDFNNHIEIVQISNLFTWQNADNSYAYGIELEGKKQICHGLDFRANVTFINSQTTVDIPVPTTRSMFGQAPYIINGLLSYSLDSLGLNASIAYNVQGPKLAVVTTATRVPNVYELPRNLIDFTLNKKLSKYLSVNFRIRNLLNAPIRRSYDFDEGWLLDFDRLTFGTNYVLGFSFKL